MFRLPRHLKFLSLALVVGVFVFTALAAVAPASAEAHARSSAKAYVRVLHASPDAPAVNIVVNGATAVSWLKFGHITGYLKLQAGTPYDVKIVPAAKPSVTVLELRGVKFAAGYQTVAAIGLLNPGKTGNGFTVKVFADNNRNADDQARIRVVHLSPNAPAVDVYAARNFGRFAKAVSGATYPNATGYLTVPEGFYRFAIAASPSSSAASAVYKTSPRFLREDSTYTAWAIGLLGKNFTVLLTRDAGSTGHDD